jgi:hypothetical protein
VYHYSKSSTCNIEARKDNPDPLAVLEMKNLVDFLLKNVTATPGVVYRGIHLTDYQSELANWLREIIRTDKEEDKVYQDKGFTSASLDEKVARRFACINNATLNSFHVVFEITHHSGRPVQNLVADYYKWENEVLFLPKTRFRVLSYERNDPTSLQEIYYVKMVEMQERET